MKRLSIRLLIVGLVLVAGTSSLQAGQLFGRMKREAKPKYPPRYVRVSTVQDYVFRNKEGEVESREVYSGYAEKFPMPAMFEYGYPHTGYYSGLGF